MALSCGCEIKPGIPITAGTLQAHYKHTIEAILFWELMHRQGDTPLNDARLKLSQARIDLVEAIDELYPEASSE